MNEILFGDCREIMRRWAEQGVKVQMCVTSPPYFGLRDYGVDGQLGLEQTPDEYVQNMVEVFRAVRDVLADDGTLWLNLGDSYAANRSYQVTPTKHKSLDFGRSNATKVPDGLKPKDLIGIPWAVATALRDPYYTGRIKNERDRAWIAAMIDGEGTICGFHHVREDGSPRTGVHITITNSSTLLLDEAHRIWPTSRSEHQRAGAGHLGTRTTWRWIVHGAENKMLFLREVYPYLVAKKRQAMVAYNLLLMVPDAKRVGHSPGRDAAREKRAFLVQMLSDLNQGRPVDLPSWLVEPPSLFEPGYYLRQDIIWHKPNPMPESVTDRCTKAHEFIFLLSKSPKYYFDAEAIKEPSVTNDPRRPYTSAGAKQLDGRAEWKSGQRRDGDDFTKRNRRSVWTVATRPYKGAHFATFPPALIEPCILAGSRPGDIVLDPFMGSGTTAEVAILHGRQYLGCELNEEYRGLQDARIRDATAARKLAPAQTSLFDTVPDSTAPDQEAA
jgi:DNA modification methylase